MIKKGNKKDQLKLFIVRKYIMARSANDALKKEKGCLPDDCWLDDEYRKMRTNEKVPAIGFNVELDD